MTTKSMPEQGSISQELYDIIQDYMELQSLIPDDNGGRMLCLVNEKLLQLFLKISQAEE